MSNRGFTLLEIILATSLFALLMGAYYSVFNNVVELESYARDQRAFGSVGPAILDVIEDDLLSMYTHPRAVDAFPFRGEDDDKASHAADKMNFAVQRVSIHQEEFHGNDGWVRSPINEVGYRLAGGRTDRVRRLYRRESYYVDSTPLDGGDYYEIYDRVVAFDLKYVGYRVEEEERSDQDSLGEKQLETFDSWDSDERKYFPTAVIVTLTIEPPRLTVQLKEDEEEQERRTFVRIIRLTQADDVIPEAAPNNATTPGTGPTVPGSGTGNR